MRSGNSNILKKLTDQKRRMAEKTNNSPNDDQYDVKAKSWGENRVVK
jgi:hypothetical protein